MKKNIEKLLQAGEIIQVPLNGYSMYPLFTPGRDKAIIQKVLPEEVRVGDVLLFRRKEENILVLHRVCRITEEGFWFVGDNQVKVEGPVYKEQIRGKMVSFIRKGKPVSVEEPVYRGLVWIWLFLRPLRYVIMKPVAAIRRTFRKVKK